MKYSNPTSKRGIIFLMFLFFSILANAQLNQNGDFEIIDFKEEGIRLVGWKYMNDDNHEYAKQYYDDSNWQQFNTKASFQHFLNYDFNGFGWFRLKLIIPDSLKKQLFSINIIQLGALHLYANGKLIKTYGKPSKKKENEILVYTENNTFSVNFNSDTVVLAVKYSKQDEYLVYTSPKFIIIISKSHIGINNTYASIKESGYFWIVFGFLLALSILHFLLFIYYPEQKENLYYSLFVLFLALVTINELIIHSTTNFFYINHTQAIIAFSGTFIFIFLQKLLYELFNLKKQFLKYFFILGIVMFTLSLLIFNNSFLSLIFFIIIFIDVLRVIIIGIRKKRYGYKYVGIGSLIFILGILYQVTISNNINISGNLQYLIISFYFLALPLSMSILLARKTSDTNKDLSKQLNKVEELSAITLAQEQEKKHILENKKTELEHQVKERTEEVVQQKEEIEEINRHLTDSITYASRIQKAILGNADEIVSKFKDAFIFLKPHSIVSGDFYWFTEIKNTKIGKLQIIIAADCTGHGVPGAFMTVMGHDFLEEIVNKQDILMPNDILYELDKRVTSNLKKQTSIDKQVNDGMDIAILVYANDNQKLYFAGAKNPLYYIRNNEAQIIKGSRNTIGGELYGKQTEKNFELHTIEVLKNDKFYIFSDGFQDQFGGNKNRKYMTKNFKELILKNSQYPMQKQKQNIEEEFYRWKSEKSQTDDILIIGVEF